MDVISDVIRSQQLHTSCGNVAAIKNIEGLNKICVTNVWEDLVKKSCLISVENDDTLCLPRAITVAVARYNHVNNPGDTEMKRIYDTIERKSERGIMHIPLQVYKNKRPYNIKNGQHTIKQNSIGD